MTALILALAKLLGLTLLGYALFSIPGAQGKPKKLFATLIMKGLIPLYYLYNIPLNWAKAEGTSPLWLVGAFVGSILFLLINTALGKGLAKKLNLTNPHKWTFPFLMGIHNAGYIPIPLMMSFAPPGSIMTYIFIWSTAFNLYFWSYIVYYFEKQGALLQHHATSQSATIPETQLATMQLSSADQPHPPIPAPSAVHPKFSFKLNGPLVGLLGGFILAALGVHPYYPEWLIGVLEIVAPRGFDGVLILLGAILAGVDRKKLTFHKEFASLIGLRFLAYPLVVGLLLFLLPAGAHWNTHFTYSLKMSLLIQAFAPPATNLMIITGVTGQSKETTNYTASGIVYTYLAAFMIMPILLLVFGGLYSL